MTCPRCQMYPCRCRARYGLQASTYRTPLTFSPAAASAAIQQHGTATANAVWYGGAIVGAGAVGLLWAAAAFWYMRKKR